MSQKTKSTVAKSERERIEQGNLYLALGVEIAALRDKVKRQQGTIARLRRERKTK